MLVAFSGSVNWTDFGPVKNALIILKEIYGNELQVTHGAAIGLDSLVGIVARYYGIQEIPLPADWQRYGKSAGMIRNAELLRNAQALVAYPLSTSRGTLGAIRIARQAKLPLCIYYDGKYIQENTESLGEEFVQRFQES